jgi:hypothetical protein
MKVSLPILFVSVFLFASNAKAQQTDSLRQAKVKYLSSDLGVTEEKAKEVILIMESYKANLRQIIDDSALSEDQKKQKFSQILDEKNAKYKKILTTEQLKKIVPASELNKL